MPDDTNHSMAATPNPIAHSRATTSPPFCHARRKLMASSSRMIPYAAAKPAEDWLSSPASALAAMNITATEFPAEVNEFERAGLTPIPSVMVKAPRVLESPIHFECKLVQTLDIGDGHIVIGEIVYMHFSEEVYKTGNYIDTLAYQPIGRLAGNSYSRVNDLFQILRPPSEIKAKD